MDYNGKNFGGRALYIDLETNKPRRGYGRDWQNGSGYSRSRSRSSEKRRRRRRSRSKSKDSGPVHYYNKVYKSGNFSEEGSKKSRTSSSRSSRSRSSSSSGRSRRSKGSAVKGEDIELGGLNIEVQEGVSFNVEQNAAVLNDPRKSAL
jgi:hypothetical protein